MKKLQDVVRTAWTPGGTSALLTSRPRSIASFLLARGLLGEGVAFQSIIDGGANAGQFARAASRAFPGAMIYSFEPLPDVAESLRANLADLPLHRTFTMALGNRDGHVEFHRAAYSQASSVLPFAQGKKDAMRKASEVATLRVEIGRLDSLLTPSELKRPVLLKLDVQGFELEALKGAEKTLSRCDYVLVEAMFERLYEGEPLFDEVWAFLRDRGFRFMRPLSLVEDRGGRIIYIDALFVNSGSELAPRTQTEEEAQRPDNA